MVVGWPHPEKRIRMSSSRFISTDELVRKCTQTNWPTDRVFLEYSPNAYLRVNNAVELHFACEVVSRYHAEVCDIHPPHGSTPWRNSVYVPTYENKLGGVEGRP